MNKILTAFLILFPLAVIADDFDIQAPVWEDYVPAAFANVKEPKGIAKINVSAVYWYKRRVDFEKGLEECQALETNDEKYVCYEKLKIQQYKENSDYNAQIEARQSNLTNTPAMRDMTDTMVPINNYINAFTRNMPNEMH